MKMEAVLALVRHGLTTGGALLVSAGLSTDADIQTVAGAIVIVIGFGWSLWRKYERTA